MPQQISYGHEVLRKAIHLSSLWIVGSMWLFSRTLNIILLSTLLVLLVLVEYGNHRQWALFRLTYGLLFNRILRENEKGGSFQLSGAPYLLGSALMSVLLFPREIAMLSFSIMLIGDTFAALVGRRFGRHKINQGRKSLEGSIAFVASSLAVLAFFAFHFDWGCATNVMGIIGICLAALAETYENRIRIDDNFSIPLVAGSCVWLATLF